MPYTKIEQMQSLYNLTEQPFRTETVKLHIKSYTFSIKHIYARIYHQNQKHP